MANERHTDAREWDIDFSTRQSSHPYTKYQPIKTGTTTAAAPLFTIDRGEVATNWVTNPRVEAALSSADGFTATGSAITRETGQKSVGAASLFANPANSEAGEGWYWTSPMIPFSVHTQHLSVQLEHRGESAASAVKLEIRAANGVTVLATSGSSNLAAAWTRVTAQYTVPASTAAAVYRLYLTTQTNHNIGFYADKIMFEVRNDTIAVSTYVDGASGINYSWTSTANASTSIKKPAMTYIRGITLKNESGTSAEIVYVSFDTPASATTGIPIFAGETFENTWPLGFTNYVSIISASGTPSVHGVIWGV